MEDWHFNKVSFIRIGFEKDKCVNCGLCVKKCKMGVDVQKNQNSAEYICCGDCIKACPCKGFVLVASKEAESQDSFLLVKCRTLCYTCRKI